MEFRFETLSKLLQFSGGEVCRGILPEEGKWSELHFGKDRSLHDCQDCSHF